MKVLFRMALVLGICILSGCGFALRKPAHFAPILQYVYINTATPNDPFVQTLERTLVANNIDIVTSQQAATAILNILSIQTSNTMNANGGISAAGFYTAYLTVEFSLTDAQGNNLIAPNSLQQSQSFTSNATQVLSGNLVASQLANQMDQAIAEGIIDQLAQVKQ